MTGMHQPGDTGQTNDNPERGVIPVGLDTEYCSVEERPEHPSVADRQAAARATFDGFLDHLIPVGMGTTQEMLEGAVRI